MDLRNELKSFSPRNLVSGGLLVGAGVVCLFAGIREIDTDPTTHRSMVEEIAAEEAPDLPFSADTDFALGIAGISLGIGMATARKRQS